MSKSTNVSTKTGLAIITVLLVPVFTAIAIDKYYPKTWNDISNRLVIGLNRIGIGVDPPSKPTASTQPTNRTFLGRSATGYELWTDGSCVFVKGLRQSDLYRLNDTLDGFKQAVKNQTGKQCVLFE